MSWNFKHVGQKAAVAKAVRAETEYCPPAIKEAIAQVVETMEGPNVMVSSDGHVDAKLGGYGQFKMEAAKLDLDPVEP